MTTPTQPAPETATLTGPTWVIRRIINAAKQLTPDDPTGQHPLDLTTLTEGPETGLEPTTPAGCAPGWYLCAYEVSNRIDVLWKTDDGSWLSQHGVLHTSPDRLLNNGRPLTLTPAR